MGPFDNEALGLIGNLGTLEPQTTRHAILGDRDRLPVRFGASMSPHPSTFAPLLFAGRLAEGIEALPKSGFTAVEISLRRVSDLDVQWLDKRLSELGLAVSAFATGRMCLEDSLCLCDTNLLVREHLFERFVEFIHLAAHFQASLIIGGVRGKLSGNDHQKSEQRKIAVYTLRNCAMIAGDLGVNLLIEPINRYETNFINTALEAIELIDTIDHASVKLLLDTFHMNMEETDPCLTIRTAKRHLRYVHFADNNRQAPGQGHINFPAIIEALAEIGYQGFITAEILPIPDDQQALLHAGQYLHSLMFTK
jgi:sugar phosphate isomerase/epimerase